MNFEQRKNTKAVAWTVGVHSLLLLLFLLLKYTLPAQAVAPDEGIEVNLGTTEDGFGTDQPEDREDPAAASAAVASNAADASDNADREVQTTDEEDAPVINTHKPQTPHKPEPAKPVASNNTPKRTNTQANGNIASRAPSQTPRYVYPGATGKGGNSAQQNVAGGNEGIGKGNGDMGVPGGMPGASNYTGTPGAGGGSSMRVSLSGRTLVSRPDPKAEFREGGQVKIHVTVNRDGVVTDSRVVSAANATIRALALKKLQSVRFNQSPSAPAEQFGDIIFDFRATRK